jgi:hypothetical protein
MVVEALAPDRRRIAGEGNPLRAAGDRREPGHSDMRMTERHYAHLVPLHVAHVIRVTMPKLGLLEPSPAVPLAPAPTTRRAADSRGSESPCTHH